MPNHGYSWPDLHRMVGATLRAGLSVLVRGHPGVGKSTLAQALASDLGLPLVDIRLAQRDPTDLCGVWFPDESTQTLKVYPPAWAVEASKRPMLIFLDEINAAVTKLHQSAAYQIVLEKRVGEVRFHPETVVLAAGNLEEDNAIVSHLSSALCNRFSHYVLRVDADSWLAWASAEGLHPSILGYVGRFGDEVLYDPGMGEMAFPSPRSWAMASRLMAVAGSDADAKRMVASCIGMAHAERFFAWRALAAEVDVEALILTGKRMRFSGKKQGDPSFIYGVVCAVAGWLRHGPPLPDEALPNVARFLTTKGLDEEFVVLFLRQIRPREELYRRLQQEEGFRELATSLVERRVRSA
jgi:MoxR-like ATPase